MKAKIYHNPRCSKSRATLALLEEHGVETDVIEYLRNPPTSTELRAILKQLGLPAAHLIRKGEAAFRDSGLTLDAPEDKLIALMASEPIVIERPIVVVGNRARIGRPPESVLELIR